MSVSITIEIMPKGAKYEEIHLPGNRSHWKTISLFDYSSDAHKTAKKANDEIYDLFGSSSFLLDSVSIEKIYEIHKRVKDEFKADDDYVKSFLGENLNEEAIISRW